MGAWNGTTSTVVPASTDFGVESLRGFNTADGSTHLRSAYSATIYKTGDTATAVTIGSAATADATIQAYYLAFRGVDVGDMTYFGKAGDDSRASDAVTGSLTTVGDHIPSGQTTPPIAKLRSDGGMVISIVGAHDPIGPFATPAGWTVGQQAETAIGTGGSISTFYRNYTNNNPTGANPGYSDVTSYAVTGTRAKHEFQIVLYPAPAAESGTGTKWRSSTQGSAYYQDANVVMNKPLGTTTGDVMIAVIGNDEGGDINTITAPSGWTERFAGNVGQGQVDGAGAFKVFTRTVTAADASVDKYTFPKGTVADGVGGIVTFTGAIEPGSALFNFLGGSARTTTMDAPSVTGAPNSRLLTIFFSGDDLNTYRYFLTPSGQTARVRSRPNNSGGWIVLGMFTEALTSSAATGVRTATSVVAANNAAGYTTNAMTYGALSVVIPPIVTSSVNAAGVATASITGSSVAPSQSGTVTAKGTATASIGAGVTTPAVSSAVAAQGLATAFVSPAPVGVFAPRASTTATIVSVLVTHTSTLPAAAVGTMGVGFAVQAYPLAAVVKAAATLSGTRTAFNGMSVLSFAKATILIPLVSMFAGGSAQGIGQAMIFETMASFMGSVHIVNAFSGATRVKLMYVGSTQVWP
jgi:hypothetical protein